MKRQRRTLLLMAAGMMAAAGFPAFAQSFPNKPIRWIVGYNAGGALDFVARVAADAMSKSLGQQVIIDNRPGAAGAIAAAAMVSSPADGHTLLSVDMGAYTLNPHLYASLQYDPRRDFKMVGMMVSIPMVLFVPTALNANTLGEFIDYVKSKPSESVNFASSGMGNPTHLTMELFQRAANLQMTHVPYKGSPPALTDLITGKVSAFFVGPNDGIAHVKSGKLKILATATPKRVLSLPEVPTLVESGYDVGFQVWLGLAVSASTPATVVERLNQSLNDAIRAPDVAKKLADAGFEVSAPMTSQQTDDFARAEYDRWGKILPPLNIKLD